MNLIFFQLQSRLNEVDEKGSLPLDLALISGQEGLAQTLVDHKCNVNQLDPDKGDSLLHKAIHRSDQVAGEDITIDHSYAFTNFCVLRTPLYDNISSTTTGKAKSRWCQTSAVTKSTRIYSKGG